MTKTKSVPILNIKIIGERELDKIEILRNSKVIHEFKTQNNELTFNKTFVDSDYQNEKEVLYYYIRATQKKQCNSMVKPD